MQPDQDDEHGHDEHITPRPPPAQTPSTEQPDSGAQAPASPVPSFLSLPDIAHASIASYLPDGDTRQASPLPLSEVSRAQLESYGGSLTRIRISHIPSSRTARLVALLRRQTMLIEVIVDKQESIPAFCEAIVQGCCQRLEIIDMRRRHHNDIQNRTQIRLPKSARQNCQCSEEE